MLSRSRRIAIDFSLPKRRLNFDTSDSQQCSDDAEILERNVEQFLEVNAPHRFIFDNNTNTTYRQKNGKALADRKNRISADNMYDDYCCGTDSVSSVTYLTDISIKKIDGEVRAASTTRQNTRVWIVDCAGAGRAIVELKKQRRQKNREKGKRTTPDDNNYVVICSCGPQEKVPQPDFLEALGAGGQNSSLFAACMKCPLETVFAWFIYNNDREKQGTGSRNASPQKVRRQGTKSTKKGRPINVDKNTDGNTGASFYFSSNPSSVLLAPYLFYSPLSFADDNKANSTQCGGESSSNGRLTLAQKAREMVRRFSQRSDEFPIPPLEELGRILAAVCEAIAWCTLSPAQFHRFYRSVSDDKGNMIDKKASGDNIPSAAELMRNYVFADKMIRQISSRIVENEIEEALSPQESDNWVESSCVPCSHPAFLPQTAHKHPLWESWGAAQEHVLSQLCPLTQGIQTKYVPTSFFTDQLTAFEVWLNNLSFPTEDDDQDAAKPEQLSFLLAVLSFRCDDPLFEEYHLRTRTVVLLCRYLEKVSGHADTNSDDASVAVHYCLACGILQPIRRLLRTAPELLFLLTTICFHIARVVPKFLLSVVDDSNNLDGGNDFLTEILALDGSMCRTEQYDATSSSGSEKKSTLPTEDLSRTQSTASGIRSVPVSPPLLPTSTQQTCLLNGPTVTYNVSHNQHSGPTYVLAAAHSEHSDSVRSIKCMAAYLMAVLISHTVGGTKRAMTYWDKDLLNIASAMLHTNDKSNQTDCDGVPEIQSWGALVIGQLLQTLPEGRRFVIKEASERRDLLTSRLTDSSPAVRASVVFLLSQAFTEQLPVAETSEEQIEILEKHLYVLVVWLHAAMRLRDDMSSDVRVELVYVAQNVVMNLYDTVFAPDVSENDIDWWDYYLSGVEHEETAEEAEEVKKKKQGPLTLWLSESQRIALIHTKPRSNKQVGSVSRSRLISSDDINDSLKTDPASVLSQTKITQLFPIVPLDNLRRSESKRAVKLPSDARKMCFDMIHDACILLACGCNSADPKVSEASLTVSQTLRAKFNAGSQSLICIEQKSNRISLEAKKIARGMDSEQRLAMTEAARNRARRNVDLARHAILTATRTNVQLQGPRPLRGRVGGMSRGGYQGLALNRSVTSHNEYTESLRKELADSELVAGSDTHQSYSFDLLRSERQLQKDCISLSHDCVPVVSIFRSLEPHILTVDKCNRLTLMDYERLDAQHGVAVLSQVGLPSKLAAVRTLHIANDLSEDPVAITTTAEGDVLLYRGLVGTSDGSRSHPVNVLSFSAILHGHTLPKGQPIATAYRPGDGAFFFAGVPGQLQILSLTRELVAQKLAVSDVSPVTALGLDGTGSLSASLAWFDSGNEFNPKQTPHIQHQHMFTSDWSPLFAVGLQDGGITMFDVRNHEGIFSLRTYLDTKKGSGSRHLRSVGHPEQVLQLCFANQQHELLAATALGVKIFDLRNRQVPIRNIEVQDKSSRTRNSRDNYLFGFGLCPALQLDWLVTSDGGVTALSCSTSASHQQIKTTTQMSPLFGTPRENVAMTVHPIKPILNIGSELIVLTPHQPRVRSSLAI